MFIAIHLLTLQLITIMLYSNLKNIIRFVFTIFIVLSYCQLEGQCPSTLPSKPCGMGPTFTIHADHHTAGLQNVVDNDIVSNVNLSKDGHDNVKLISISTVDVNPFTGNDIRHVQSNFDMHFIYSKLGTSRKVVLPSQVKLYCKEYPDGTKRLTNSTKFLEPEISDGGALTKFFDALGFIFQVSYSEYIEGKISEELDRILPQTSDIGNNCSCIDYNHATKNIELRRYEINTAPISTDGVALSIGYVSAERLSDRLDQQGSLVPQFEYWINNNELHNPWLDSKYSYEKGEKLDLAVVPITHDLYFQKPKDLFQIVVHSLQGNGCFELPVKDLTLGQNIELFVQGETIVSPQGNPRSVDDDPNSGRYYTDFDLYKITFKVEEISKANEDVYPGSSQRPSVLKKKRIR